MKEKISLILLAGGLVLGVTGCSSQQSTVEQIAQENIDSDRVESDEVTEPVQEPDVNEEAEPTPDFNTSEEAEPTQDLEVTEEVQGDPDVDVDLTVLSSNMVYAEVFQMMRGPESYEGKKIKIRGTLASEYWEETGETYHYVIISDALACCQSGIEFIWDENKQEYPKDDTEIEITGIFSSYEEKDQTYYYLKVTDQPKEL